MRFLVKFDRLFAWILFVTMILFLVSGYGMTKGIITNSLAISIHNKVLPPIMIFAFTAHAWYAIHKAFKRWQIWNWFTMVILGLFFVSFVGYFGYLQYFYQQANSKTETDPPATTAPESTTVNTPIATPATTPTSKTFTLTELAKYNGKNGQPSYIAVNGKIYDVSSLFVDGTHRGCTAGQDVTANFSDIHSQAILSQFSIIGTLAK
jgi:predicted heme/steroid binding protein